MPVVPVTLSPLAPGKGELIRPFIDGIVSGADSRGPAQHEFNVISACVAADRALHAVEPAVIHYA